MELNEITYAIRGAVFEVNKILGHGFLEKVYENALIIELRMRGLKCESQVPLKVHYKDNLVGEYIGQTAPKVKTAITKARGGVLFIDEAYALARSNDDSKDFGREAIEILVKEMSNGKGDLAIIVAG